MTEEVAERERLCRIAKLQPRGRWWPADWLLEMLGRRDERINDLLCANSALVEERRVAQGRAEHFKSAMEYLLRINQSAQGQIGGLETEIRALTHERDQARKEAASAWREAERWMRLADRMGGLLKASPTTKIAELAKAWYRTLVMLDKARNVETNRAYTQAHLALKEEVKRDAGLQKLAEEGQKIGVGY